MRDCAFCDIIIFFVMLFDNSLIFNGFGMIKSILNPFFILLDGFNVLLKHYLFL